MYRRDSAQLITWAGSHRTLSACQRRPCILRLCYRIGRNPEDKAYNVVEPT